MTELLSLDDAWARLSKHIEWSDRFWLLFVFTDDPRVIDALRRRMQEQLTAAGRELVSLRPRSADDEGVLDRLLAGRAGAVGCVDFVRHDPPGESKPWRQAWQRLCMQLNQRRELLGRRWAGGGILLATTLDRLDETPAMAPDLWTVRALLLRVATLPSERVDGDFASDEGERSEPVRDVELARQAVDRARKRLDDAALLETLTGLAEAATGEEALAAADEARELVGRLEEPRGIVAACLVRLGRVYGRLEERAHAQACLREGIARFEAIHGTRMRPEIADALLELAEASVSTKWDGRGYPIVAQEQALAATQEAVEIWRAQLAEHREGAEARLAEAFRQLAIRLAWLGLRGEAFAVSQKAVEHYRKVAVASPDTFLRFLAKALDSLGLQLLSLGRREEALKASQESVAVRKTLASASPNAFLPELATALNNLGTNLRALGRHEEALAASQDAVEIRRRLASASPDTFLPVLAAALCNLGVHMGALGLREQALATLREAVEIQRKLASASTSEFLPELAMTLNNLGGTLNSLDREEEALAPMQEAVEVRRKLASGSPDAFLPDLATSLYNLGTLYDNLGQYLRARDAYAEALTILLPFFIQIPAAHAEVTTKAALALHMLEQHGAAIPDTLAPIVEHFVQYTQAGSPEWTEANLNRTWEFVRLHTQTAPTPGSPETNEAMDVTVASKSYMLYWALIAAFVAAVLALAKALG